MILESSETVLIVQICADTLTAVVLATIALLGRWIIFREALAIKKQAIDHHDELTAEIADLRKEIREKP